MAQKRMFSLLVVDTDRFAEMPTSAQALYFHLGMHGDDDGFVASPSRIARSVGCNADDLRILAAKGFIIPFSSGVVVITDWAINNTLKNDRYKETIYITEKSMLGKNESGQYVFIKEQGRNQLGTSLEPTWNQSGSSLEPQHNITELNLTEPNRTENIRARKRATRATFTPPTVDEVRSYCEERKNGIDPVYWHDFYESKGWMVGKNKMKDWKASIRTWERNRAGNPGNSAREQRNRGGSQGKGTQILEMIQSGVFDDD